MTTHEYDVAVVGAGTGGCYAAATVASAGYDVVIVERKTADEAGHIACGDALKGANNFPEEIPKSKLEPAFTNTAVDHGRFEAPEQGVELDIPVPGELAVIDRLKYGKLIIEGAREAGTEFHYDTVVKTLTQDDTGRVTGFEGVRRGEPVSYEAEMVIDGAGALSILQDKGDFSGATMDTNVRFSQFSSAYREVVEVEEPVEWHDALVFKPTKRSAGYLWYFPRTPTEINVGLGFQMSEEPMKLVGDLREDLQQRPEFKNAKVKDKLGAALPTRRTYDSGTAPGYIAVGDAAAHVNPISGGGIAGAAYSGKYAGEQCIEAIEHEDYSEESLWEYNSRVMDHFGGRYAALDVYNIFSTAYEISDLTALAGAIPGRQISEALYSGSSGVNPLLAVKTLWKARNHLGTMYDLYRTKGLADRLLEHYESYPDSPAGFDAWRSQRDSIMDDIYAETGAEAKY
ncbi:geranylgeranyl reductase family protein [Halorarius litoreus]|uniref:geranylgeranyl reductase family protein n=1 Tax=Halorarius litoreus TaxID=2962676 RepID=UPI0020CD879D|nr:geranylgeranyl reductase family protein [Halorarius litoreus]